MGPACRLAVEPGQARDSDPDDDVDEAPAEAPDAVVFDATPSDEDAPLKPGFFDDARLKRPDATTSLVDVVLRHPGYSDKNIGQVLSILLSIEYASCLDLAAKAPVVVAWGVARERALTMKTVMEREQGRSTTRSLA